MLSSDEECKLMVDILRLLVMYHNRIWESEILKDLLKMYTFSISYVPTPKAISKALSKLHERGLIELEERIRGSPVSSETYSDRLITLKFPEEVRRAFYRDPLYLDYLRRVYESIERRIREG